MPRLVEQAQDEPSEADARRIRELERQLAAAKAEREKADRRNREYERIITTQQEHIEARAKKIFAAPQKAGKGKSWHRVIVPDTHGSSIDRKAAAAFLRDVKLLQPQEIVWIGDHLECGGFLAQHHVLGYVAQSEYTFTQDVADTNAFLDSVQEAAPSASHRMLEGNHEGRIEAWCMTQALRNNVDAQYLLNALSPSVVLHLPKRGITFHRRSEFFDGLKIRGTIRMGECHFTHGTITAKRAAAAMLARYGSNVVFGHTHRIDQVVEKMLDRIIISSSLGCLSELQPLWRHSDPTTWSHGYGVQICRPNGEFLHITVPIIDGESLLGPLIGAVK